MGEAAQALPFRPHSVGEHLADVDPDNCSLREREECDVADQEPHQEVLVVTSEEDHGNPGQTRSRTD